MGLVYLALTLASSFSHPRAGAVSGRSFEPIVAILLFSCTLALHARQVDVKLRLDYLWAAQARGDPLLPFGGVVIRGSLGRGFRWGLLAACQ